MGKNVILVLLQLTKNYQHIWISYKVNAILLTLFTYYVFAYKQNK